MATFDLKKTEGLRDACREAERRLDESPEMVEKIAKIAEFLQKVQEATADERASEAFLRLIWEHNQNPLYYFHLQPSLIPGRDAALTDPEFREWFRDLTDGPAPEDAQEKVTWLDERMRAVLRRVWPDKQYGSQFMITRAFTALFPHDFAAHKSPGRKGHLYEILSGNKDASHDAQVNRWLLDHIARAVGQVDRADWNAVARRMLLLDVLVEIHGEQANVPASASTDGGSADNLEQPDLGRITEHFESVREDGRLIFERNDVEALHLGLWAHERRHFAVLTGLSGTGKTRLAIEYAKVLTGQNGESNDRLCTIAVQPGWHDSTPLLGYVNPLGENRYTATEFVRFLMRAAENRSQPHVCVLDEMNLSHPEQYLAPILSAMELDEGPIELHGEDAGDAGIPPSIRYPGNLVLIGTVNMDETTMGISDKVLDRAFTLEFWDVKVDRWPGWAGSPLDDQTKEFVKEVLMLLMAALSPARLHFGWRVIEEVVRFMEQRQTQSAALSVDAALDRVLYAKVLPKLRGDDAPRVRTALDGCKAALAERNLSLSTAKVEELIGDLDQLGSFRFWR